ncbi:MAG: response regulator transcription factor [Pseudomonadota bacterium]
MEERRKAHNTRIVIADDHAMVRDGLAALFAEYGGVEIADFAKDGLEAIALCRKLRPDLLTLDVGLPLANGAEVFAEVQRWSPETRVVVFTGFTAPNMLADWVAAGVEGLFLKTCSEEELRRGIKHVLDGGKYIARDVVTLLETETTGADLTPREREVLASIAAGLTTTQIGERLFISPKTVEKHRASLFEKFRVSSVAALVTAAFKGGYLDHLGQT